MFPQPSGRPAPNFIAVIVIVTVAFFLCCQQVGFASQSVHLTWVASPCSGTVGYNVYYGLASGEYTEVLSVTGATAVDVGDLQDGATYYFVVTAYDGSGTESVPSNEATYQVSGIAPPGGAPFIQQIWAQNSVTIGWNSSPSPDVLGYTVYYGTQSGVYDYQVWVTGDTTLYVPSLSEGLTYYFAVTSTSSNGVESAITPELLYSIPPIAPPQQAPILIQNSSGDGVTVSWGASPSVDVAGYRAYYGTQSGVYDSWVDVGLATSVDIEGLFAGVAYFFAVTAYSSSYQESDYSPETASYTLPVALGDTNVYLSLLQTPLDGFPNAFSISASGAVPNTWTLEGSSNLKTWKTLATGVVPEVNVMVVASEKPALFFRLFSWFSDLTLGLDSGGTNRYPNSFVLNTPDTVPWDWTLESSEDLQNWNTFTTGFFTPVSVVVINAATPQLFFRLKSG